LWFRGELVLRFQRPAPVLEMVLKAFQRCRWSSRIADPVHRTFNKASHRRLRAVIQRLNAAQRHQRLLRFGGDGSGEAVCWEPRA
jgi:hypothetical protein